MYAMSEIFRIGRDLLSLFKCCIMSLQSVGLAIALYCTMPHQCNFVAVALPLAVTHEVPVT